MDDKKEYQFSGYGDTSTHNSLLWVMAKLLEKHLEPQNGKRCYYDVMTRLDYNRTGLVDDSGELRDMSVIKHNYNFDLSVSELRSETILAVIEVEYEWKASSDKKTRPFIRYEMIDCLKCIEGLEHAYIIKLFDGNGHKFVFLEMKKIGDEYREIPTDNICGVPTSAIEEAMYKEMRSYRYWMQED